MPKPVDQKINEQRLTDPGAGDEGHRLAEAVMGTIRQPLLVLNAHLRVEAANHAFCRDFDVDRAEIAGRHVHELRNGEWAIPELQELLADVLRNNGTVQDYRVEHEFEHIGRRVMVLSANRLRWAEQSDAILIAIDDITEEEQARALLVREREYFEKIVDSTRDALLILDFNLRVKRANNTFYDTFGVDPSATEGQRIYELGGGEWDIPKLRDLLENVLPENHAFDDFEVEHDFTDLGHRTMMLNARRVDHMQLILLAIEDQTAARRADQALRESEFLRRVLDNLFAFVALLTPDGIVMETNLAPLKAAGIDLPDVQGRRFEDCYWWSYSAQVQTQLREAMARATLGEVVRYDVEIRVADGRLITIDFMIAPLRDEAGAIIGLIPSAVDITERNLLTEERFQAFLDVAPDALIMVRSDRTIRSVSAEAERLFGYVRSELVGRPIEVLMPERYRDPHIELQETYFANPRRRAMGEQRDVRGLTADGREIPLEVSLSPIEMPEGTMALAAVRDITERKQAEQRLRSAMEAADSANHLKSRFIAAASHDLRQPLQTIGLLGGVLAQTVKDEASRSAVAQLRDMVAAMRDIISTLLDIDRLDTGRMEPEIGIFPIERLLDRMRSQFGCVAEERSMKLRSVSSSAIVRSDPRLLERLVGNLVSNAIKYSDAGGRVLLGCRRRGDSLRVEVWDTGVGIPKDQLESVFDEYHRLAPSAGRAREPGLGLGLALVKRLSAILNHRVEVHSNPGRGSVFAVELPLAYAGRGRETPATAPSGEATSADRPTVAILLVEDEAGPRESLRLLLELNGYGVRAVATVSEALDLQDYASPPRLVIADNHLGENMTGLQMIRGLREATGWQFPAIVLTGDSTPETRREIESAGCRHEVKPTDPDRLLTLVGELVGPLTVAASAQGQSALQAPSTAPVPAASADETVFVVEDDREIRGAMRSLLEASGLRVEEYSTAETFLQAIAAEARRGCVVLDVGLPGMSGLLVQERLQADGVDLPVIVVTGRHEVSLAVRAMRAGAVDFLQKPFDADRLLEAIDLAMKPIVPSAAAERQSEIAESTATRFARLTPREREVLGLVADGQPNKEIAHRLGLSPRTVENYRARGLEKLGTRSLAELVRLAVVAEASGVWIFPR